MTDGTAEELAKMTETIDRAANLLGTADIDVVVYASTTGVCSTGPKPTRKFVAESPMLPTRPPSPRRQR